MNIRNLAFAGGLLLGCVPAVAAGDTDWAHAQRVDISLSSYAFTPDVIHLHHGLPYILRLTNTVSKGHNFSAPEFFSASSVVAEDAGKLSDGAVELGDGQSADIRLVPGAAGTYDVHCTHFLHSMLGMKGKIVVD